MDSEQRKARRAHRGEIAAHFIDPWMWVGMLVVAAVAALWQVPTVAMILVLLPTVWTVNRYCIIHDLGWCSRCNGSVPLNPAVEVTKHRRALRVAHRYRWLGGAVIWAALGSWWLPWLWVKGVVTLASVATLTTMSRCLMRHKKLQLWCPWCNRGGGGWSATVDPDRDPVPAGAKTR